MKDRIDDLGQQAWMDFYNEKKRLYGNDHGRKTYLTSDTHVHHKFYRAFREIATICLARGFDVTDYVYTCFSLVEHDHKYVTPRDFVSDKIVKAYVKYKEQYGDSVSESWTAQSVEYKSAVARLVPSMYKSAQEILLDNRTPYTAWFRVFYGQDVDPDIFVMYSQMAWADLHADKRLRALLRNMRPNTMQALERLHGWFGDTEAVECTATCTTTTAPGLGMGVVNE